MIFATVVFINVVVVVLVICIGIGSAIPLQRTWSDLTSFDLHYPKV